MLDLFNYLFGVNYRCRVECRVFLPGFLVEGFSMSQAASFSYSLVANRRGGWKIFQILIGAGRGKGRGAGIAWGWGGGEGIFKILIVAGGGFSKTSKIFLIVFFNQFPQSKQVSPRLTNFSYYLAQIF